MELVIATLNITIFTVKSDKFIVYSVINFHLHLYLVLAMTRRNSNVMAILQFLHRLVQVKM